MSPNCEWCRAREATCAGVPHVGPLSWMCDVCKERLCRRDALGQFIAMTIERAQELFPKGFYHIGAGKK